MNYRRLWFCVLLVSSCTPKSQSNDPVTPKATGPERPTGPSGSTPEPTGPVVNKPRIEARDPLQNDGYRFYDNTLEETVDWWPLSDEEVGWFPRSDFISYYSDSSCRSPVLRAEKIGCSAIEPQKYAFDHQFSAEGGWLVSDYGRVVKAFAVGGTSKPGEVYEVTDGVCGPATLNAPDYAWYATKEIPLTTFAKNRVEKRVPTGTQFEVPVIVSDFGTIMGAEFYGQLKDLQAGASCSIDAERNGLCAISAESLTSVYDSASCTSIVDNAVFDFQDGTTPALAFSGQVLHKVSVSRQFAAYEWMDDVCEENFSSYFEVALGETVQQRSVPMSSEARGEAEERIATVGDIKISLGYFAAGKYCYPVKDAAGTVRCAPPTGSVAYTDDACTQPVGRGGYQIRVQDACNVATFHELLTEQVPTGTRLYQRTAGVCEDSFRTTTASRTYYKMGGPVDLTKYPRMD